jgi:ABC-type dipeptide/oligopeptide/nickel transport system permease component
LLGFIIKRVVFGYLLVLFAVFIFFIVIRSCVSDIQFAPLSKQGLSPAEVAEQTQMELERYHLNGSVVGQAFHYLYNIIPFFPKVIDGKFTLIYFEKTCTSNFGAVAGADLGNIFATAMPTSLAIGGIATIFAYLIGVPLGIFSAQHKNKKGDVIITSFSNFLVVVPSLIVVLVVFVYSTMNGMSGTYELGSF